MAKLYYGNGDCSIEGDNIKGVQIFFSGTVHVGAKVPTGYELIMANNQIIIFPLNPTESLSTLFTYRGNLKIKSVIVADNNAKKIPTTIKKVMDYSELLESNAEDITVKSENLNSGYKVGRKVLKSGISSDNINNLHTDDQHGNLYLESGDVYEGSFHIHTKDASAMTGALHTIESQDLYIKQVDKLLSTKNPSHEPQAFKIKQEMKSGMKIRKLNKDSSIVGTQLPRNTRTSGNGSGDY